MYTKLKYDQETIEQLLQTAVSTATDFIQTLPDRPAAIYPAEREPDSLPEDGLGTAAALATFQAKYGDGLSGSAGPRYFGFVTGGSTPAALIGDWITAVYDQNPTADEDSIAPKEVKNKIDYNQIFLELFLDGGKKKYVNKPDVKSSKIPRNLWKAGEVRVKVIVGEEGRVESASILRGINDIVDEVVLETVNNFEYQSGCVNGQPVKFSTSEVFRFK